MPAIQFLAGLLTGVVIGIVIRLFRKVSGTLKIDRSSSEKDLYRFEIDNLDDLSKKKHIVLKIDNNADLSQK